MELLYDLFGLLFLLFLIGVWVLIPKPDIDRSHLISTRSARGGLTLRLVRNLMLALFMLAVILSAYADESEWSNTSRYAMIGALGFWSSVVLLLRIPNMLAEATGTRGRGSGYRLQWGNRTVTYSHLRAAAERWVTRLIFLFMLANALAVVLP